MVKAVTKLTGLEPYPAMVGVLARCPIKRVEIDSIAWIPHLREDTKALKLTNIPNLSNQDMAVIVEKFPHLQTLSFSVISDLMTVDAAILLTTLDQLCVLSIDGCYFIDDRALHILIRSLGSRLIFLHLMGTHAVCFDTLKEIHGHAHNLETLHISVVTQPSRDEIWFFVASCNKLRRLVIFTDDVIDECCTFTGMNAKNEECKISIGMF